MPDKYIENIDLETLNSLFTFDFKKGKVFWKNPPKNHQRMLNKEAGCIRANKNGKCYWRIKVNKKAVLRSHIIFYAYHGFKASPFIDHIDGNSLNDNPSNLRQATIYENAWNHKSRKKSSDLPMGIKKQDNKFVARITHNKKQIFLGYFSHLNDAVRIYQQKRIELYGKFSGY